jgi:hypothetical protein
MTYRAYRFTSSGKRLDVNESVFQFDDVEHAVLVQALASEQSTFPLLSRLRDEYSDQTFGAAEMPRLRQETRQLAAGTRDPRLASALDRLGEVSRVVEGEQQNLCFEGD